jgi:hypothetical protein
MQLTRTPQPHRPPHPVAEAPLEDDGEFLRLLTAYRASGGLATGVEIAARSPQHGLSRLARAIAAREVLSVQWSGQHWLPVFQFEPGALVVREPVRTLIGELTDVLADWELAQWFVEPNGWLVGATPLQALREDAERVHDAARVLRFLVRN